MQFTKVSALAIAKVSDKRLSLSALAFFTVLRSFSDGNGTPVNPSREKIALRAGIRVTGVSEYLKKLQAAELIRVETIAGSRHKRIFFLDGTDVRYCGRDRTEYRTSTAGYSSAKADATEPAESAGLPFSGQPADSRPEPAQNHDLSRVIHSEPPNDDDDDDLFEDEDLTDDELDDLDNDDDLGDLEADDELDRLALTLAGHGIHNPSRIISQIHNQGRNIDADYVVRMAKHLRTIAPKAGNPTGMLIHALINPHDYPEPPEPPTVSSFETVTEPCRACNTSITHRRRRGNTEPVKCRPCQDQEQRAQHDPDACWCTNGRTCRNCKTKADRYVQG